MHYGRTMGIQKREVITVNNDKCENCEIGQRRGLSEQDVADIHKLYGCRLSYDQYKSRCDAKIVAENLVVDVVRKQEKEKYCPYIDCSTLQATELCPDKCIGTSPTPYSTSLLSNTTTTACDYDNILFIGNSYIALRNNFIGEIDPKDGITIKLSIRASDFNQNQNALLLWQGSVVSDNFIAIGIKSSQIQFNWNSNFYISTPSIVEEGTNYDISVSKEVKDLNAELELSVKYWNDNDENNKNYIVRTKQFMQEKAFEKKRSHRLYLGGAKHALGGSAVSSLTGGRYTEGYHGCISRLKVRKTIMSEKWGPISYGSQVDIKTNKENKNVYEWGNTFCRETCGSA